MPDPAGKNDSPSKTGIGPHGLIVLDKPPGPTSYDCIRFLRRTCEIPPKWKMGHLGTLDPFASGLVVIALGQAVRYAEFALHSRKRYRARLFLGEETDTLDPTGKVINTSPIPSDWKEKIEEIGKQFVGEIEQVPPVFSAKQVDGKRSYKAARKGEKLELEPVRVTVYELEFGEAEGSWIDFSVEVSGGTYIRALARDMARAIGTVGHLAGLERLSVGPFDSDISIPFEAFEVGGMKVLIHHLRPVDQILAHLPSVTVVPESEEKLLHGQMLGTKDIRGGVPQIGDDETLRLVDENGRFKALGRMKRDPVGVGPYKPWLVQETETT